MIGVIRQAVSGFIEGWRLGWWRWRTDAMERAIILVRQGVFFEKKLAHRLFVGDVGEMFAYDEDGLAFVMKGKVIPEELAKEMQEQTPQQAKRWKKVFWPQEYNVFDDERFLMVVDGEVVSSPIQGTGQGLDHDTLSHFVRGNAVHQATHSFRVYGKGMAIGGLRMILVIFALAVIGFLLYHYVISPHLVHTVVKVVTTPTPFPTSTPFPTIHSVPGG